MIGTYDNLKLCSYLFVADKFDNSEKIFESFSPIIESLLVNLGNQPYISFMALQEKIDEIYTTRIPKATLKMLLNNLKAEGKIKINNSRIYINGEMLDSQYFNERNKKEQELNELFLGFRQFLLMKNIKITLDEAKQIICKYIFTHCFDLVDFIGHSAKPDQTEEEDLQYISYICEYLCKCKSDGKVLYTAFLRLYKGTVQSTLLNFYPEKIESLQNLNLQIDKVILDSNFIMRILDIQTEIEGQMAQETIYALNSLNVELVVLPQTIEEVSMSIKRFLSESAPYLQSSSEYFGNQHIRMSGLLAAIQRGKTRTNLMELSKPSILKEKLVSAYGICVIHEEDNVPIDLAEEIDSLISSKGIDSYGMKQATHDMLLINYCRQNRKKGIDSFTDARIWVLTNDMKLTYWNQNNSSGIQECITESQLSNLLWIQTPKEDNAGLINTMVALANRELINTTKFYEFINKMQVYKQLNNNPSAIDNISLIFACDCLTMNDISRISDDDHEIDNVIKEKMEIIRKDREENELLLQQSSDENAKLKVELKIYKLMIEKEELLKKIQENRNLQEHLKVEIQELQERRDDL